MAAPVIDLHPDSIVGGLHGAGWYVLDRRAGERWRAIRRYTYREDADLGFIALGPGGDQRALAHWEPGQGVRIVRTREL